jgi:hypothetical protein
MSMAARKNNVVLIGGHRKSGTTMLHSLFDGHPGIYAPPHDLNILYAYYPEWTRPEYTPEERKKRLQRVVLEDWREAFVRYGLDNDPRWVNFERYFRDGLNRVDTSDIQKVLDFIVDGLWSSAPSGTQWLIIKETSCEMYAPWILGPRPGWKFIHLFRDPRDNYAAIKAGQEKYYSAMGNDIMDTISSTILRYKLGHLWNRSNAELFGPERYTTVLFEDVVQKTESEMTRIAAWMGVPWDPVLCTPTRGGAVFAGNSHDGKAFDRASSAHVGRWKSRITDEEAQTIEFVLGDEMAALGYSCRSREELSAEPAGQWYSLMNYKYFFADSFEPKKTS